LLDRKLGRVKRDDLHSATQPSAEHRVTCALRAEHAHAEDPGEFRLALEHRSRLLSSGIRVVQRVFLADHFHTRILRNSPAEALAALFGRADTDIRILDEDLALTAQHVGQRVRRNAATLDVVRANVRQWEGYRAVDIVAVTDEGVNRDDLDPRV